MKRRSIFMFIHIHIHVIAWTYAPTHTYSLAELTQLAWTTYTSTRMHAPILTQILTHKYRHSVRKNQHLHTHTHTNKHTPILTDTFQYIWNSMHAPIHKTTMHAQTCTDTSLYMKQHTCTKTHIPSTQPLTRQHRYTEHIRKNEGMHQHTCYNTHRHFQHSPIHLSPYMYAPTHTPKHAYNNTHHQLLCNNMHIQ